MTWLRLIFNIALAAVAVLLLLVVSPIALVLYAAVFFSEQGAHRTLEVRS